MPPKVVAGEGSAGEGSAGTGVITSKANEDMKLCWAILCQMNKAGKLSGMDWNEVREQIGSNAIKTTQNRWYNLRDRMKDAGFELPAPQPKAAKTPSKRKEKTSAGDDGDEDGENPPFTPKKRKVKGESGVEGSTKKTAKKSAKQPKAEKEVAATTMASGSGGSDEEAKQIVDHEIAETNGIHAHVEGEMEVA